ALAQWRTTAGDLAGARDAWLEAARRHESASMKAEDERRARELDLRMALREELADFSRVDEATARILQAHASADDSQPARFESIPLAQLAGLVARAHVSRKAQLGWLIESIVRGDAREREIALPGLGACVQRGEIDALHASGLVARAKGAVGDGGWEFRGGAWVEGSLAKLDAAREADSVRNTRYAALIGDFRRANAAERDVLLEQIRAVADPELTSEALSKRWKDDWDRLEKNPNLRQLAAIAEERRALDAAREKALGLIFDEERYFYPYNPPECPPEKVSKYAAVQREVDELVTAVRVIWERSKRVRIGDALRQQLEAADWTAARAEEAGVEIEPVAAAWRFALALPDTADVGLTDFAWDEQERAKLVESQRIEARNERMWVALDRAKPGDDVPNSDEQNQVRITNAYRLMLGRRALAWNPRIETAAQGHSDHMANTGDFSHFEKGDPKRATPFDRMRLAGYKDGVSENICMGQGDPKSAHEGWTHSSGHHRNLLMRDHREMASAIASSYWTQNFGMDASFLTDL
ncbi:MAG: CAP domain-containing protein, partial [Planctomycetota bacterium]